MNNTKTSNPSWGSIPAAPRQQLPGARRLPRAEAVLHLLRLVALDVPICLLQVDVREQSCHFVGRPQELLVSGTLERIGQAPRSDEAPSTSDLPRKVPVFVHLLRTMTRPPPKLLHLLFLGGITGFTGRLVHVILLRHLLLESHLPGFLSRR